jgi:FkbM family methyltransferase
MTEFISWLFRSLHAKIVTTQTEWVRKPLKVSFLLASRLRAWSVKKLNGKHAWVTIRNFDGDIVLKIDRSRTMGASFYWTGFHEMREFIFLHRFLKKGMVAVDIGANLGEYTLFMAKRLTEGKIFSYEPMLRTREQLLENITLNGFTNVAVVGVGLSDKEGVLEIHEVEDVHEGLNTFYLGERKSRSTSTVALNTLDREMEEKSVPRIDFIKVDIEGSELPALRGARNSIARWRPYVMVEINDLTFNSAGYTKDDVGKFFSELNYIPCSISKRGELEKGVALPSFGNIVFAPQ